MQALAASCEPVFAMTGKEALYGRFYEGIIPCFTEFTGLHSITSQNRNQPEVQLHVLAHLNRRHPGKFPRQF